MAIYCSPPGMPRPAKGRLREVADYDVIVIGAGLGGLTTGALVAKEGLKTLVLEQSDIIGGCCSTFEVDGYKFDVGASIVEVIQPLERLFEMLGGKMSDYLELIPCDPIYSFITEDGKRFSVPTDIDETTELVKRIAPEDVEGWKRFCEHRPGHDGGDDGRDNARPYEHFR